LTARFYGPQRIEAPACLTSQTTRLRISNKQASDRGGSSLFIDPAAAASFLQCRLADSQHDS